MATLDDKLAEMRQIKAELKRMENDESVTEEDDGDLRDTLVARYRKLDEQCKPIIARMQEIQAITRLADDEANLERADPDDDEQPGRYGSTTPELVVSRVRDPYDNNEAVRSKIITRGELRERALDAVELEAKRGNLAHDFAEEVTRKAQDQYAGQSNIARHVLLTGGEEYQQAFREYLEDPQGTASRAALSLTLANGGFVTVAAA